MTKGTIFQAKLKSWGSLCSAATVQGKKAFAHSAARFLKVLVLSIINGK